MHGGNYENYHENKSHTSAGFPYNTYLCTIPQDFDSVTGMMTQKLYILKKDVG